MRISDLGRYALGVCTAAMLAGCGGASVTPLSPSPAGLAAERMHMHLAYSVLYSFKGHGHKGGKPDGAGPAAGLLNVNGSFYGTTYRGGANGYGTVFAITTSGTEKVLYSFKGGTGDGAYPGAGLINVNGTLYGTTYFLGGAYGAGTVFAITTSGKEKVLHSFGGGSGDGEFPYAGLIDVNGTLYGTTTSGGAGCGSYGCGTVFSITTSGKETVLYRFNGGSGDGEYPSVGLINVKGTLYSTTIYGGVNNEGTVFAITTSGTETVLHSFGGSGDGKEPDGGLINVKGTLYSTTVYGGVNCKSSGCGTVFAITTSGKETVLHSFGATGDGEDPYAGLLNVNGTLYGTTLYGGSGSCSYRGISGCGTVFSITPSGTEAVLHSFGGSGDDGENPHSGLINVKGTLYSTTFSGGANDYGTVFSISP